MSSIPNLSEDIFDWQGISITQQSAVHKVGTDAVLLGGWVRHVVSQAEKILDAGTGTGIIALMMARYFPNAKIHAIDIDQEAFKLASSNVVNAQLHERISVSLENILNAPGQIEKAYDLILSNPPFYNDGILPSSESKARAKHISSSEAAWIGGLQRRLRDNGHMCIIVPWESAVHWIREANAAGYYNVHRTDIFSFRADCSPRRSLLHFTSSLCKPVFDRLTIYTSERKYTPEYLQLTGIRVNEKTVG